MGQGLCWLVIRYLQSSILDCASLKPRRSIVVVKFVVAALLLVPQLAQAQKLDQIVAEAKKKAR